jgi:hypothetical protein
MKLSLPVRIAALAGLVLALGVGTLGTLVLAHRKTAAGPVAVSAHAAKRAAPQAHTAPKIDSSLPAPLRAALAHSAVVVAVLDAPGMPGDGGAVTQARQGAHAAHAGFALLNVRDEANAAALFQKAPNATDPAVLVVRRPGTIAFELDGFADSQSVAQAAIDAR